MKERDMRTAFKPARREPSSELKKTPTRRDEKKRAELRDNPS